MSLPYGARQLSKTDLSKFEAFFAYYLSIQKQKEIDDMNDHEVKGRWKSFTGKWNRGELAEGWYDPEMYARITSESAEGGASIQEEEPLERERPRQRPTKRRQISRSKSPEETPSAGDDSDDDYGPVLPGSGSEKKSGVGIPSIQDLAVRDEMRAETREADRDDLRAARKADRKLQKERLEELVPRAEPGTRERKMEKRQDVNAKMKEFREKSPGMEAGNEKELMGGGDELEEYKKEKEREQRRKSERELRREEIQRAKQEEMEERKRKWQEREQGTMSMLQELARQRFG